MKKILLIIFLIINAIRPAFPQENGSKNTKTTGGIKAEATLTNFLLSGVGNAESNMKTGATLGGFLQWDASKHFALQAGLLFNYKSSDFISDGVKSEFQYAGAEIPVYAIWYWKFRNDNRFYFGIGPYSEFGFGAQIKRNGEKINLYKKDEATELSAMSDFNSGFGLMAGYEFVGGLQFNAGYKLSITNILDANSSTATLLPHAISLGVGYRFGK